MFIVSSIRLYFVDESLIGIDFELKLLNLKSWTNCLLE